MFAISRTKNTTYLVDKPSLCFLYQSPIACLILPSLNPLMPPEVNLWREGGRDGRTEGGKGEREGGGGGKGKESGRRVRKEITSTYVQ